MYYDFSTLHQKHKCSTSVWHYVWWNSKLWLILPGSLVRYNVVSLPKFQTAPHIPLTALIFIPSALRPLWIADRSRFNSAVDSRCVRLISFSSTDTDSDASFITSVTPSKSSLNSSHSQLSSSPSVSPFITSTSSTPVPSSLPPSIHSSPMPVVPSLQLRLLLLALFWFISWTIYISIWTFYLTLSSWLGLRSSHS